MVYTLSLPSPLGDLTLASRGEALCGLWFNGQKYFAAGLPADREERDLPVFRETRRWLEAYFSGTKPDFLPPLAPEGTPFRRRVWEALLTIPYGETVTYGELAQRLGTAPRAVGSAVGRNPVSILIPCHRVVGSGGLTGYAGGLERKRALLEIEGNYGFLSLPKLPS